MMVMAAPAMRGEKRKASRPSSDRNGSQRRIGSVIALNPTVGYHTVPLAVATVERLNREPTMVELCDGDAEAAERVSRMYEMFGEPFLNWFVMQPEVDQLVDATPIEGFGPIVRMIMARCPHDLHVETRRRYRAYQERQGIWGDSE